MFSIVDFPLRVCIKARWVSPYVFNRVRADLRSPTSLKDVLLVKLLRPEVAKITLRPVAIWGDRPSSFVLGFWPGKKIFRGGAKNAPGRVLDRFWDHQKINVYEIGREKTFPEAPGDHLEGPLMKNCIRDPPENL